MKPTPIRAGRQSIGLSKNGKYSPSASRKLPLASTPNKHTTPRMSDSIAIPPRESVSQALKVHSGTVRKHRFSDFVSCFTTPSTGTHTRASSAELRQTGAGVTSQDTTEDRRTSGTEGIRPVTPKLTIYQNDKATNPGLLDQSGPVSASKSPAPQLLNRATPTKPSTTPTMGTIGLLLVHDIQPDYSRFPRRQCGLFLSHWKLCCRSSARSRYKRGIP